MLPFLYMNFFSFDLRKILLALFIAAIPLVMLNIDQNPEDTAWYKIPFSFVHMIKNIKNSENMSDIHELKSNKITLDLFIVDYLCEIYYANQRVQKCKIQGKSNLIW